VWIGFRRKFRGQRPYAFVLHGNEGAVEFHAQVLTEQGLTKVARRYVAEELYETVGEARQALRYSICDSPYFDDFVDNLPRVAALVGSHAEDLGDPEGYNLLAKPAIAALKKLDAERLFGHGAAREGLLLMISTFDTEFELTDKSAKALNSKAAVEKFLAHN